MGRPKRRWMDGVVEDLRKMGIQRWWMTARDRESWKNGMWEAKAGCSVADDEGPLIITNMNDCEVTNAASEFCTVAMFVIVDLILL